MNKDALWRPWAKQEGAHLMEEGHWVSLGTSRLLPCGMEAQLDLVSIYIQKYIDNAILYNKLSIVSDLKKRNLEKQCKGKMLQYGQLSVSIGDTHCLFILPSS